MQKKPTAAATGQGRDHVGRRREKAFARALLLACLLLSLLSGCDLLPTTPEAPASTVEPTADIQAEPTETLPPGVTSIVFWEPLALDRPQGLLLGEMVRDFEAENPDLLVEIVPKSGYGGIDGAMMAGLEGGELPDLAVAFPSMIAQYAAAGVVAPLDPYLYHSELGLGDEELADLLPGLLEAGRLPVSGRQIMAFPFAQNAIGMWVNRSLLSQAGWDHVPATWDEFEQACFDVVAYTGVGCYPFVESASTLAAWIYSRGGQTLDPTGRQALFNEPPGVESLALLRRLIDAGLAWRPADPYGDYVAFANGQAAFTFSSTGNSQLYVEAYEAALKNGVASFQWQQAMIPQADPQNPATALYGASFFIVQADPARQEAAWRLIRWFTDARQSARWGAELEAVPVRLSALDYMTDTLEAHPFVRTQVEKILPHARPEPAVPAEFEVRDLLYTAILSVTQSYVDPQAALDQAAAEANALLSGQ
jgi:ABC-type glycerol-3-phosphate transport system substrate-binding protein